LAEPYVHATAQDAGAVAELAAARKTANNTALESYYPINCSAVSFLSGLGRRIA